MATKNRSDLKSYFVKNAIPTEGNFADLIDSQLNQAQDGVFKPDGEALSVTAAPGDQKRVLRLYASYPAASPDWMISLHPAPDPASAATPSKPGFGITDGAGKTRLFIDAATGQIGVGTNTPQVALDVAGGVQANGFRGRYDLVLNDYRTVNPASNTCLQSPGNDRDAWIYRDPNGTTSNWGIYHRQIDTAVGGLPGNSIGFVGGSGSKLQAYISLGDGSGFFAGNLTTSGAVNAQGVSAKTLSVETKVGIGSGAMSSDYKLDVRGYSILTDPDSKFNSHFPHSDNNVYVTGENIYLRGGATNVGTILTAASSNKSVTIAGKLGTAGWSPTSQLPGSWGGGVNTWDVIAHGAVWSVSPYKNGNFDVAEKFANHEDGLEPGDVVAVDPMQPERLIRSPGAWHTHVLGVISEKPGFELGVSWEDPEAGVPLALCGRVPVKVTVEGGAIRIGDYLTSASRPGYAMRATGPGRVIGVALKAFDGAPGAEGKTIVMVNSHWYGGQ